MNNTFTLNEIILGVFLWLGTPLLMTLLVFGFPMKRIKQFFKKQVAKVINKLLVSHERRVLNLARTDQEAAMQEAKKTNNKN